MPYLTDEEIAQYQAEMEQGGGRSNYRPQGTVARGQVQAAPVQLSGGGGGSYDFAPQVPMSVQAPSMSSSGVGGSLIKALLGIKDAPKDPMGDQVKGLQIQKLQEEMQREREIHPYQMQAAKQKLNAGDQEIESNKIAIQNSLLDQTLKRTQVQEEALKEYTQRSTLGGLMSAQIESLPESKRAQEYKNKVDVFKHIDENAPDEYKPQYTRGMIGLAAATGQTMKADPNLMSLAFGDEDRALVSKIFAEKQDKSLKGQSDVGKLIGDKMDLIRQGLGEDSEEVKALDAKIKQETVAKPGNSDNLRNSFIQGSKDFTDVNKAYNKIQAVTKEPSAAGDMALIFNYMKMLDPGSTVREGEYATAEQAGSVPSRVLAQYNKLINGEKLAPEQRTDFLKQSGNLYKATLRNQDKLKAEYSRIAKAQGLDPETVVMDLDATQQPQGQSQVSQDMINQKASQIAKQYGISEDQARQEIMNKIGAK